MFRSALCAVTRRCATNYVPVGGRHIAPSAGVMPRYFSTSSLNARLLDSAVSQLRKLKAQNHGSTLRLKVNSGGCSGFEYEFTLLPTDEELSPEDLVLEHEEGVRLVVDKTSNLLLDACEIEYKLEMIRSAFQVGKNKLADQNCSCGSSFSVSF